MAKHKRLQRPLLAPVVPYAMHIPEAARYTGIGVTVLRSYIKTGALKVCRPFKKKLLVRTADLRELIDARMIKTTNVEGL